MRHATIYEYRAGPGEAAPFAVSYYGDSALHVLSAEGGMLGAMRQASGGEAAAREWGAGRDLEVAGIRPGQEYEIPRYCVECRADLRDCMGVYVFTSELWRGIIATSFLRCVNCTVSPAFRAQRRAEVFAALWKAGEHGEEPTEDALRAAFARCGRPPSPGLYPAIREEIYRHRYF